MAKQHTQITATPPPRPPDTGDETGLWAQLERNGRVTPEAVVDAAKDPAHPWHNRFEWDDSKAAHAFRIAQARILIRAAYLLLSNERQEVRIPRFVRDQSLDPTVAGYITLPQLREEQENVHESVVYEFKRAQAAMQRAQVIAAALEYAAEIIDVRERIDVLARRVVDASNAVRPNTPAPDA